MFFFPPGKVVVFGLNTGDNTAHFGVVPTADYGRWVHTNPHDGTGELYLEYILTPAKGDISDRLVPFSLQHCTVQAIRLFPLKNPE